ncbi:MAG: N-acetylmuramoyl-L-alanine amidase [bacterium]|nr:N-acetylmuramoyl-L-alanine amidase [bacterium]
MRKTLIIIFLFGFFISHGQRLKMKQQSEFVSSLKLDETKSQAQISSEKPITAISLSYEGSLNSSSILIDDVEYKLFRDEHYSQTGNHSNLIILEKPVRSFELFLNPSISNATIKVIHCPQISKKILNSLNQSDSDNCEEPMSIDQSVWRNGLPSPSYSRSFTATRNIIVHHTATSNSLTDFTNVVRNIYLFHTEDRGWSDIGYNYLIAQDGTIFKGRDPASGEQDLVRGAHFCASNSNTMGVSLLGNLSEVEPTDEAIESLTSLLNWKTLKDQLDPLDANAHPLNSNLGVIAGHRDGCATECPGNFTYPRMDNIRGAVADNNDSCLNPPVEPEPEPEIMVLSYGPNPVTDLLSIEWPDSLSVQEITLIDLRGKATPIKLPEENTLELNLATIPTGLYLLSIRDDENVYLNKIIKE